MKTCPACNTRFANEVQYCNKDGTPVISDSMAAQQSAEADAMIGQVIADRYRLTRKLGEGGMGEVYQAEHVHIEKRVAVKLLRAEIVSNEEAVKRFRQEARSASSIGHENIIAIDDFGQLPDGRVYLTMEFLQGQPLSELIRQPVPFDFALDVCIQTCRGLAAAHAKGIIHRDMKPENIFVTARPNGRPLPKILDFGIAKVSGTDNNQNLTRTGTIFGTPFYMAPEQALGQRLDHRADIYAMGVILFEVFTGTVPYKAESFMGILTQHITGEIPSPTALAQQSGRQIVPELEQVILVAMKKNPAERYATMNDLAEALAAVYRKYVGPGATAPHAPPPVTPSQFLAASSSPLTAAQAAQATPGPMPFTPVPGTGTANPYAPTSYSEQALSVPQQKKGGKGWLIAVLAVLVLGGGAAGWYFGMGPGARADDAAGGPAAKNVDRGGGEPADPRTEPGTEPIVGPGGDDTAGDPDPGADAKEPVAPVEPPPADPVPVLVDSIPRGALIESADGKRLGKTPKIIDVVPGDPVTVTLSRRGYEDETVELDGSEEKVTRNLDKKGRKKPPVDEKNPKDIKDWSDATGDGKKGDGKKDDGKKGDGKKDDGLVDDGLVGDDADQLE